MFAYCSSYLLSTLINHFELPSHLPFTLNTYSCTKSANKLAINNSSSLFVAPIKSSKVSVIKYRFCLIVSSVHLAGPLCSKSFASFLISQQFPFPLLIQPLLKLIVVTTVSSITIHFEKGFICCKIMNKHLNRPSITIERFSITRS